MRRTLALVLILFLPGCTVVNGPVAVAPPVVEPFASPGGEVIDEAEWCRRVEGRVVYGSLALSAPPAIACQSRSLRVLPPLYP